MSIIIDIKNIDFSYNKKSPLIEDFSLEIEKEKIYCLIGENGAGKSTLLKLISGIENLEKASGFIKAKATTTSIDSAFFDCGKTSSNAYINELIIAYNITVRKGDKTSVTINTFTEVKGLNVKYHNVHCNSTGAFENGIFEYILNQ